MNGSQDWAPHIARAEDLARDHPEAAGLLRLYRALIGGLCSLSPQPNSGTGYTTPNFEAIVRREAPGAGEEEIQGLCRRMERRVQAIPCPDGHIPLLAILRPEGDGGKRSLLCGICGVEWEFRRIVCPNCGEEDKEKLPVYTAEEYPHVRIEACDSCGIYLKAIDLTKNGLAVPEVDEIATVALDFWAREKGYRKLTVDVLGV